MFTLWNASTAWLRNLQRLYQRELDQQEVARLELQARPETLPFLARRRSAARSTSSSKDHC
jgi:hypothetical protein